MKWVEVNTQAQFDAEVKFGNGVVVRAGFFTAYGSSQVTAYGSSQVTAYDSSQVTAYGSSQVTAYGSSQVTACGSSQVTACDSSQVRAYGSSQVTAYGSSQVTACDSSQVTACDSSQVRAYGSSQVTACDSSQVTACDSSQVTACDSSQVTAYCSSQVTAFANAFVRFYSALKIVASASVVIMLHAKAKNIKGGKRIKAIEAKTPKQWCEMNGVEVAKGRAIVYKALNNDCTSPHGAIYKVGTETTAPDWKKEKECGNGLHFSPHPALAVQFHPEAKRFMACSVKLTDMRPPKSGDNYPQKCKAKSCKNLYEVDLQGNKMEAV